MRKRTLLGQAMGLVVLLASSACAVGMGAGSAAGTGAARPVQLQVTNTSGGPIEIYATGTGTSYRVGTVHPGLTGRFVIRPTMVSNGAVEFTAHSPVWGTVESGPMLLRPGDVADFALTPYTATSRSSVRAWVGR